MKHKLLKVLAILIIFTITIPFTANATIPQLTAIGAPEHFGVSHYSVDAFFYTISAPDDMRALMDSVVAENPSKETFTASTQIDYKLENGDWHYTSDWDTAKASLNNTMNYTFNHNKSYIYHVREKLSNLFPNDKAAFQPIIDKGWEYFKDHSISFRIRFALTIDGGKTYVHSNWSNTYVLSNSVKSDPDKLINHAPTLVSATVERRTDNPYLIVKTGRLPGETQDLNSMTPESVWTEIWMRRAGEKDFKMINSSFFSNEYVLIGVDDYFDKTKQSYDAESYEIKIRYKIDLRAYRQSTRSDIVYSPFSNVFSQNMPAWSEASKWATAELKKAADAGLIPDILKGADMTKPITREEFAELAVLLYEKTTNKESIPTSPNIFTDTANQQILKAFNLGITSGTSATTFSPKVLINREQSAAMLFRALKVIAPLGDYSISGVKDFPDQKEISSWAVEATKYMSKISIITGNEQGYMMPKAGTTAQEAAGYGMATREQAIAMTTRIFEKYK